MQTEFLILQICDFLDDGDGFYRLHEPSRCLGRLPGVTVVDCHFYHHSLPALAAAADVVVLPFLHDWDLFPLIESRRATGRITVFEANDYFYDVQPWSPIARQWQDRSIQEEYRHYLRFADGVQTSTAELARRWQPYGRQVAVFRNQLSEIPPLVPCPQRPLTIGWGGSPGHFADWYEVTPLVQRWLEAHPDVHVAVMTNEFAKPFLQLPTNRYHFTPFGSLAAYVQFLPRLDIGLAPLLPTDYNRGRSDVKFLEYASHGVAGVYADLEPYRDSVRPGETGLMYRTGAELLHCLDRLAGDVELRRRIRAQAHEYACRERRVMDHIGERLEFYRGLLPAMPLASVGIPANGLDDRLLADAVRDGNYFQLRPGPLEKGLLAALETKPAEAVPALGRLLQQAPGYQPVLFHLGRLLNDARDHTSALNYLTQALAVDPKSARVLSEQGRARFCLGDIAGARSAIEAALGINPYYYPGWQYLLRLLGIAAATDGPSWAERARQRFPTTYALALLGAGVYRGEERVGQLQQLLDEFAPTFKADEIADAADAFGQAFMGLAGPAFTAPAARSLLARACEVFPHSARIANLAGLALHMAGEEEKSQRYYVRALELYRVGLLHRQEFPREDGSVHFWQFAEHIRNWRKRA